MYFVQKLCEALSVMIDCCIKLLLNCFEGEELNDNKITHLYVLICDICISIACLRMREYVFKYIY